MKKYFTLIEMIVVIVILGILAAIVVPNTIDIKEDAKKSQLAQDLRIIQSSVDAYKIKEDSYPIIEAGKGDFAKPVNFDALYPKYIRTFPKNKLYYWIDKEGVLWYAEADSPTNKTYDTGSQILKWEEEENAISYIVYKKDSNLAGGLLEKEFTEIGRTDTNSIKVDSKDVFISSIDKDGNQSPPMSSSYKGYEEYIEISKIPTHYNIKWKVNGRSPAEEGWSNSFDGNDNTETLLTENRNHIITWEGDLTNRVVKLNLYSTHYRDNTVYVLDENDNPLPFVDVDHNQYNQLTINSVGGWAGGYPAGFNKKIVIPEGAAKIKIYTASVGSEGEFHVKEIADVTDKVVPQAITDLIAVPDTTSILLKWTNPEDEDFDKVAIYRDNKFIGFSTNGNYNDPTLYTNRLYNYDLYSVDKEGNISEKESLSIKTINDEIIWHGPSPAIFDRNSATHLAVTMENTLNTDITWEGNLINKKVQFDLYSSGYRNTSIRILDANNNPLSFKDINGNTYTTVSINSVGGWAGGSPASFNTQVIIPEGASKIRINSGPSGGTGDLYIRSIHDVK